MPIQKCKTPKLTARTARILKGVEVGAHKMRRKDTAGAGAMARRNRGKVFYERHQLTMSMSLFAVLRGAAGEQDLCLLCVLSLYH